MNEYGTQIHDEWLMINTSDIIRHNRSIWNSTSSIDYEDD